MITALGILVRHFIVSLFVLFFAYSFLSAQHVIRGVVYDKENSEPIHNANIYINRQSIGTTTDSEGYFSLKLPSTYSSDWVVIIDHVAYDTLQVAVKKALELNKFALTPKSRLTDQIVVEAKSLSDLSRELPISVSVIDAKRIESKGFVDAGDLLRTNQSIQVDESLSGKKTISLRAGTPDNVLVLYNGIRLNNNYDNIFDLSMINLEDIKQIEIIKGSNTALFGSEALSGVINIVPKIFQTHKIRFIQKFGSYNSGNWNLQLNHNLFDGLYLSYSQKRAGSERGYSGSDDFLKNKAINHAAHITYDFSKTQGDTINSILNLMYLHSTLDYSNNRLLESTNDLNQVVSLSFNGEIGPVKDIVFSSSYQLLENTQSLAIDTLVLNRRIDNKKFSLDIRKTFHFYPLFLTTSYQYDDIVLDYDDKREFLAIDNSAVESLTFTRKKQGIVGLAGFESDKDKIADKIKVALSYRYDHINDSQKDIKLQSTDQLASKPQLRSWHDGVFKASAQLKKVYKKINYNFMFSS